MAVTDFEKIVLPEVTISHGLLRLKLAESLAAASRSLTRRDVRLPGIADKCFAVIGVRRGGKTSFLAQCRADRLAAGRRPEGQLFLALEDAYLVRTVAVHSASERQRLVNPRKAYPIDPGLIALFERSGKKHQGHALETVIMLELERRGYEVAYVRTASGFEADFIAHRVGEPPLLIQSCLESEGDATWDRELRALEEASAAFPEARPLLITLDAVPPRRPIPGRLEWSPVARRLSEER